MSYSSYLPDAGVPGPVTGGWAEATLVEPESLNSCFDWIDAFQMDSALWRGDHKVSLIKELYCFEKSTFENHCCHGKKAKL